MRASRDHAPSISAALEWRFFPATPEPGRRVIALYDDGSGAKSFYSHHGGFIDADGDNWSSLDNMWAWAYAPAGYKLWCETREFEPFNFPEEAPTSAIPADRDSSRDELLSKISQLEAELKRRDEDARRMDWLERHTVNVRIPLAHGSADLFWATPDDSDEGEDGPSDLRAKIDAALQPETVDGK